MWYSRIFSARSSLLSEASQRQSRMRSMLTRSDRKQLLPLLAPFRRAGAFDFSPHPFAVQAVLREHQQQAVVDLDGPVDLLDEFLAPCMSSGANQTRNLSPRIFSCSRRAISSSWLLSLMKHDWY